MKQVWYRRGVPRRGSDEGVCVVLRMLAQHGVW